MMGRSRWVLARLLGVAVVAAERTRPAWQHGCGRSDSMPGAGAPPQPRAEAGWEARAASLVQRAHRAPQAEQRLRRRSLAAHGPTSLAHELAKDPAAHEAVGDPTTRSPEAAAAGGPEARSPEDAAPPGLGAVGPPTGEGGWMGPRHVALGRLGASDPDDDAELCPEEVLRGAPKWGAAAGYRPKSCKLWADVGPAAAIYELFMSHTDGHLIAHHVVVRLGLQEAKLRVLERQFGRSRLYKYFAQMHGYRVLAGSPDVGGDLAIVWMQHSELSLATLDPSMFRYASPYIATDLVCGLTRAHAHGFVNLQIMPETVHLYWDAQRRQHRPKFMYYFDTCTPRRDLAPCGGRLRMSRFAPPEAWDAVAEEADELSGSSLRARDVYALGWTLLLAAGSRARIFDMVDAVIPIINRLIRLEDQGRAAVAARGIAKLLRKYRVDQDPALASLPPGAREVVLRMTEPDPRKRCSAKECLKILLRARGKLVNTWMWFLSLPLCD